MRHLVLSDVHADAAALDRVLADAEGAWDRLLLLGDLVGYGSEPTVVVRRLRESAPAALVRGNHEEMMRAVLEGRDPHAAPHIVRILEEHAQALNEEEIAWLTEAPLRYAEGEGPDSGLALVHGHPDPERPFAYLLGVPAARTAAAHADRDLTFIGHTHVPGGFVEREGRWQPFPARRAEARTTLPAGTRAFLNPGSVARARDGGPGGCYLIWDDETREVTVRRTGD